MALCFIFAELFGNIILKYFQKGTHQSTQSILKIKLTKFIYTAVFDIMFGIIIYNVLMLILCMIYVK